jgi:hypothetical protein
MNIKVAHIYASNAKSNSGDFMIGIAYKKYFKEIILNDINNNIIFIDFDCRNELLYNNKNIYKLNEYDYILIGGGGLILPDSTENKISCWQWIISKDNINKIKKPIYVISIGWNLFYNQNINMPNRNDNYEDKTRLQIFKDNIITLIEKSVKFTLRHNNDVKNLLNIVGEKYNNKVSFETCATIWYVNKYWKSKLNKYDQKYFAIEIKDDRQWRRYYKIGLNKYYNYLLNLVKNHINKNEKILYLSHDGSKSFYKYLLKNNINIPILDNSIENEEKIMENYSKIHTIYCSAGHSQMISYALGIKIISLVTHPKIKNFCDDIGDTNYIDVNNIK